MSKRLPVAKAMCATCPFRTGSEYAHLQEHLAERAVNHESRICHSTGTSVVKGRTGKPSLLCRGARDIQLRVMAAMRVISTPTDEAWEQKCAELGL